MGIINTAGTVEQGGIGSTKCRLQTHTKPMEIPLFGTEFHYLAGEKAINLANKIFGCSSAIQNIQIDFVDEHAQTGKVSLGLSVRQEIVQKDMRRVAHRKAPDRAAVG